MAVGSRHNLSFIKEVTRGVTPASPELQVLRSTGTTLGLSKNVNESKELRADRQTSDVRHGTQRVGGDINGELSFGTYDDLIEAAFCGTWDTDVLKVGVARRTFTLLRHFSDLAASAKPYHALTGCEINTLTLAIRPEEIVTAAFGVVGKGQTTSATEPGSATYLDATTAGVFDAFTGSLKEGGLTIGVITEIDIALSNGIEPRYAVGSKDAAINEIKRSDVSGTITAYFENSVLLDKFINETSSSIEFDLVDLAGNKYTFLLPNVKYTGGQPDVSDEGTITLSMPFKALYDATEDTNIKLTREAASV